MAQRAGNGQAEVFVSRCSTSPEVYNDLKEASERGCVMCMAEDVFRILAKVAQELRSGLVVLEESGKIKLLNSCAAELAGIDPSQVLGARWQDVFPASAITSIHENGCEDSRTYELVLNHREIRISEFSMVLAQGMRYRVQFWYACCYPFGKISDLEDTLQQIKLLEGILNAGVGPLIAVNREGRIVYLNQEAVKILGTDLRLIKGRHIREIYPDCVLEEVARTGVPQVGKFLYFNGAYMPVLAVPLVVDGQIGGAVVRGIFRNMKEAENFLSRLRYYYSIVVRKMDGQEEGPSPEKMEARYTIGDIIGQSPSIRRATRLALQAAKSDAPVLLTGETGTGKELFAHAIHAASRRAAKPFIRVNCASIPETLLESELFGYVDGAFTGAKRGGKPGKFELAHGGTLFLDEIADMSYRMQAKLLRVLQEGEIEKVGETKNPQVDVRIIAATNRDLGDMMCKGLFREDLYYRLDVIRIDIPPLRQRMEDIGLLAEHFVAALSWKYGKQISHIASEVMEIFLTYRWPGNVRELANVIEGAICMARGTAIDLSCLPGSFLERVRRSDMRVSKRLGTESCHEISLHSEIREEERIRQVLELTAGNKRRAAAVLGVARSTLYQKLKKYGLL